MKEIITISGESTGLYEEKRSEFICVLRHTETPEEAAALIESVKKQHYDARHNCWAYLLSDGSKRFSDDGEPQGTAGIPMLDVLEKSGITDVTAVVTRYFGGILLGAGGLVRAYSKAVSTALSSAQLCRMEPCDLLRVVCTYSDLTSVKRLLERRNAEIRDIGYTENVTVEAAMPHAEIDTFEKELTELSAGRLAPEILGSENRPVPISKTE